MKKVLLAGLTFIFSIVLCYSQIINSNNCIWGFTTQISSDNQFLKVVKILPGSIAELAGLRPEDRIYQINEKKVAETEDPAILLNSNSRPIVKLKINRLAQPMEIEVPCFQNITSMDEYITEGTMYNELDISNRSAEWIKLSLLSDDTKDFLKYKTYDFEYTSVDDPLLEKKLFEKLDNQLDKLGLSRSVDNPDILILMNNFSGNKERYTPPQQIISTKIEKSFNWYWGYIPVPITESKTIDGYTYSEYLLSQTLKFLDAHEIRNSKLPPVIWQGSITRTTTYRIELINQCAENFEILLYQFPNVWKEIPEGFIAASYNYTGIVYNKDDLRTILDIFPGSPAEKAGLKKGDKILGIKEYNSFQTLPLKYEEITGDQFNRYFWGIQQDHRPDSFGKYADKIGSGFVYLLAYSGENPTVNFQISRNGKKMNYEIQCISKLIIKI